LIVFAREHRLDEYIKTGTAIEGQVSEQLIRNIFFPKASLHDGAMIIRDGKIAASGCVLPLSDTHRLSADLGTRHRAGVGMSEASDAMVAICGDFITLQRGGFLMRNGEIYAADRNYSICVLYPDGTMETHDRGSYQIQDILDRNPVQVWSFGPVLLDENGQVRDSYDISDAVSFPNPRSAIGYYEPGHYCLVIVDGRQEGHSAGMRIPELAQVFADLGCTAAYNLDGGGTAVMIFDGRIYSRQSNGGRDLGDILLITESGYSWKED
jgi:exopolysaccharide biosynthesis protein